LPGVRVLGVVQRMMQTGLAMAGRINLIARQRLEGQHLARMAPAGFNPTATHWLVVEAVAWMAALRERLRAVAPPAFVPRPAAPKPGRAPQGRGAADYLPAEIPNPTEDDWLHNWHELAKPLRIGPAGVAAAAQLIADKSNEAVVEGVSEKLQRASAQMGAAADVGLIAAMEAEALALLREAAAAAAAAEDADAPVDAGVPPEAEPAAPDDEAATPDGETAAPEAEAAAVGGAKGAPTADPSSDAPGTPAEHDPPPKEPPDG
jgi:hypothetical protein